MLVIISAQIFILSAIVIAYICWRNKKEKNRDRALAKNLKLSLQRRYEMEQFLRMSLKK